MRGGTGGNSEDKSSLPRLSLLGTLEKVKKAQSEQGSPVELEQPRQGGWSKFLFMVEIVFSESILCAAWALIFLAVFEAIPGSSLPGWRYLVSPFALFLGGFLYSRSADEVLQRQPRRLPDAGMSVKYALCWMLIYAVINMLGETLILFLQYSVTGEEVSEQQSFLDTVKAGGLPVYFLVFSAIVLAPATEEYIFRGQLFRRILGRSHSLILSQTVTAILFAAIHNNLPGFLAYMWMSVIFAQAYRHTGRLWVAIFVHSANNAVQILLMIRPWEDWILRH